MRESSFLRALGDSYGEFVLTKYCPIPELKCVLREVVHQPSLAHIMHIENGDQENLFCLSFRTLPTSSNGVAHILEHTVLCGSKKYPVKDPFFSMSRRSLNTYMNAMTGSDFTCFPAASQVEKDFYNLLDVYLDAVLHPELKPLSFLQEGVRLAFADPSNPASPLEFQGVVYNEMKGAFASSDTRLWHAMMRNLTPNLPYAHDSGGDPREIPQLTYQELIEFHETFYHPSRCLFFFYGNLPLKKHLDFLQERVLKAVRPLPPLPHLPKHTRFTRPVYQEVPYPTHEAHADDAKSILALGWLTAPLRQQEEVLALCLLDSILMDTDASPLKARLLKSGLCRQADAYIDVEMSEVPYILVCKGCQREVAEPLQSTIEQALREIAEEGIEPSLIDAALHQLEFNRSEIIGNHSPFGLTLFMRSGLVKQHGCEPESALMIHSLFQRLFEDLRDPNYLTGLIRTHLLDNPHKVRLTLYPDPQLTSKEAEEETKRLQEIAAHMTPQDAARIRNDMRELQEYQRRVECQSSSCLPKVTLDDVPLLTRNLPLHTLKIGNLEVFHHECFTNGILYADLFFDLPEIADAELPYLQLFTTLWSELGAAGRSYEENLTLLHSHTGGISCHNSLYLQVEPPHAMKPALCIRGKALRRNQEKLLALMGDMVRAPHFEDTKRIEELILQLHTALKNRFSRNAMKYATHLALSGLSTAGHIQESWYGFRYYQTICSLVEASNPLSAVAILAQLKEKLLSCLHPHLVLCCDAQQFEALVKADFYGLPTVQSKPAPTWRGEYPVAPVPSQARLVASPVACTAQAYKAVPYLHPHAPALIVASFLMENVVLHPRVREEGGAYGCGATFSPMLEYFYFHSYRDPHLASTLKHFRTAIEQMAQGHFTDTHLEEAKLNAIQQLDAPIAPATRAIAAYSWWREEKTTHHRQALRDHLLSLDAREVSRVVAHELSEQTEAPFVSFTGKEMLDKEQPLLHKQVAVFPT